MILSSQGGYLLNCFCHWTRHAPPRRDSFQSDLEKVHLIEQLDFSPVGIFVSEILIDVMSLTPDIMPWCIWPDVDRLFAG